MKRFSSHRSQSHGQLSHRERALRHVAPVLVALVLGLWSRGLPAYAQVEPSPSRLEDEIRRFGSADSLHKPPPGGILFVGSSSIRMWESLQADFPDQPLVRRGFGGSEFSDLLHYADRVVFPYEPELIVVYEGDNDLQSGKTPRRVLKDYIAFVRRVRERLPGTRIAFIAVKPSIARWRLKKEIEEANALIAEYAAGDPLLDFIDVYTPMLNEHGAPRQELFLEDGLHLNQRGYALWREVVAPFLSGGRGP